MAGYQLDPRWAKGREDAGTAPAEQQQQAGSRPGSFTALGEVRGASRSASKEASFRTDTSSMSIVFNANWVKILNLIGEGAFSRVYEGVYTNPDSSEESVVAVKILKKNMLKRRSDCLRFIKEAKIMTKITHRNIVACYGIGKYDDEDEQNPGSLFIVQELVRGGNLLHKARDPKPPHPHPTNRQVYKQMLNRHKCVYTSAEALEWLCDVASGMQYLHSSSDVKPMIIHRDLKLENIMLMPDEGPTGTVAKLVDFGLHKVIDDRIKKVVKRVMSEANMGGLLARRHMQQQQAVDELGLGVGEEEDELEAALAQQRREQAAMMGVAPVDTVRRLRAPPKKQNSMQKLMAKMKEIKMRVTGKMATDGGLEVGPASQEQPPQGKPAGAASTAAAPAEEEAELSAEQRGRQAKIAQNEALLNRIIQQQSQTMAATEKAQILDDLGITMGPVLEKKRAPPRRAVTYNLTEAVGSWAYMAPEVVLGQPYNEKVDVFSFGVVRAWILFEVLNRKLMLVDEIKNDPRKDAQAYAERVARGFRPEIPRRWPDDLRELISLCWSQDPHLRPNFTAVVDMLDEVVGSGCVSKLDILYWSRPGGFA
ncbi:Protein sevenless [Tetrabaena socialis]|uniref:Protein sevenless n=1 Tax=Tetrabaena socialis TaxID=47790 RepID=A0A2J7ZYL6_9CHLO|nr:Protein sevenless [Tetrabaena socialis]|eukprot:PNH05363.1 Protein sevenless [Tetrabaena socialis]